jgi:hypothetical protein
LKQTTAQATSTNANHRPASRSHRTCSRRRQQLSHTATARSSNGGGPTASRTPCRAGRSADGSHAAADRPGWCGCRRPCRRGPRRAECGADPMELGPAARRPRPPGTWRCRRRCPQSPPRQAAAHSRHRPGGACSQACHDRPDLRQRGPPAWRTLIVSTLAPDQPSRPCSPSRSKTTRWSWSNTPALAHSVRRRQQVTGEPQPSSPAGRSRHGAEVRAMYTIAAKQARPGMARCRPPYGGRGGPAARAPPAPTARPAQGRQPVSSWRGIMPDRSEGAKRRLTITPAIVERSGVEYFGALFRRPNGGEGAG